MVKGPLEKTGVPVGRGVVTQPVLEAEALSQVEAVGLGEVPVCELGLGEIAVGEV